MQQLTLLNEDSGPSWETITNVASVPHRSPFRYPGGKTWLVPRIRNWLKSIEYHPRNFIEPFAGGAIIGLTVAFEGLAEHVTLVEIDSQVAAVWQTILSGEGPWLAKRILDFELSEERVSEVLEMEVKTCKERAFQTIVKNRVNRGGILANGAGRIKSGENGKGLKSRWYPETLGRRILEIDKIRERITFIEGDGLETVSQSSSYRDIAYFFDPPYSAAGKRAGKRLYSHSDLDHEKLFSLSSELSGSFLMTYDISEEVVALANQYGFCIKKIPMKNTHHNKLTELLIYRE